MNRRGFFGLLAGAAATKAVTYFLPPIGGWTSDVIAHPAEPEPEEFVLEEQYRNLPSELWGLHYWQVAPTYMGAYQGLSRTAIPQLITKVDKRKSEIWVQPARGENDNSVRSTARSILDAVPAQTCLSDQARCIA